MAIIDVFDKLSDGRSCMVDVLVSGGIDLFGFEGLHEALRHGVVIRAAGAAHAGLDAGSFEPGDVVAAGVLNALIGVVDQLARNDIAVSQSHLKCAQSQGRGEMVLKRPADHLAAERVQHDRQIDEGLGQVEWSKRQGVVELFPRLSSPNRTCTSQRIRLSVQVVLIAKATSA